MVFEVFPHEKKLRDADAVGCFQAFPQAAARERNNGFRGEHPGIQKRHDAGNDYAAFLDRGGSPVLFASRLRESYPLRRQVYTTLVGLIAATGLRISEALDLRLYDVLSDGVLQIRRTKFGKSRLVPLHPTAVKAFD